MVKLKIPATSANVGVGFDTLGIALSLYAEVSFTLTKAFAIRGCAPQYATKDNLIYTSLKKTLCYLKRDIGEVTIDIQSEIPIARGLGSSASCVVAGVCAAYLLSGIPLNKEEALHIANEIETHPDNVAPALFGGMQASFCINKKVLHVGYDIHKDYRFVAIIPDYEVSTQVARAVLPPTLDFSKVVQNTSKLPLLLEALQCGNSEHLDRLLEDDIHEPYRKQLLLEYEEVKAICLSCFSVGMYISGSGSTLMAIFKQKIDVASLQAQLDALQYGWRACIVEVDREGVSVC
ncbi:MAG: homoserine kinase [Breznakia sp.]